MPDQNEWARIGNAIMSKRTFEQAGVPDTPEYRKAWDVLTKSIEKMRAEGKTPDFAFE